MTTPRRTTKKTPGRKAAAPRRKPATAAVPAPLVDAGSVALETGRELWLAGLGLAATAAETAGDAFDMLVAKGRKREPETIAAVERLARRVRATAVDAAAQATHLSKKKINEALEALGVDSRPREKNLFHRLGDLTEALL